MKFRFPIVIIDEDFRSENTSGLGIRALAAAIETEGMEVLGVTSYGDLSQFAQRVLDGEGSVEELTRLSGGANMESWSFDYGGLG